MLEKKIYPKMLIKNTATEESQKKGFTYETRIGLRILEIPARIPDRLYHKLRLNLFGAFGKQKHSCQGQMPVIRCQVHVL
jgi:hypothetical protein